MNSHALGHHQPATPVLSDEELAYMAQCALACNGDLPPGAVRASAAGGWVTLSGEVPWHYQRQDAVECMRYLPGIAGVSNDITLRPASASVKGEP